MDQSRVLLDMNFQRIDRNGGDASLSNQNDSEFRGISSTLVDRFRLHMCRTIMDNNIEDNNARALVQFSLSMNNINAAQKTNRFTRRRRLTYNINAITSRSVCAIQYLKEKKHVKRARAAANRFEEGESYVVRRRGGAAAGEKISRRKKQ